MVDWADTEAEQTLHYLAKCRTRDEEIEYLAAKLRAVEAGGASRGVERMADGFKSRFLSSQSR